MKMLTTILALFMVTSTVNADPLAPPTTDQAVMAELSAIRTSLAATNAKIDSLAARIAVLEGARPTAAMTTTWSVAPAAAAQSSWSSSSMMMSSGSGACASGSCGSSGAGRGLFGRRR